MMQFDRKLKIAFIVALHPPEREPVAVMAREFAAHLMKRGNDVTTICPFPNRPNGVLYNGFRRRLAKRYCEEGRKIIRVWTWLIGRKRRSIDRILENITFGITSALAILKIDKPDVIVLETWPIFACIPVLLAAKLLRIPLINQIQDVYPEAAISADLFPERSFLTDVLRSLDAKVLRAGCVNVAISEGMKDLLIQTRRVDPAKVEVIYNWLDLSSIRPVSNDNSWRTQAGIAEDAFVCMFAGTMGFASRINILVEVAKSLIDHKRLVLVCIGEGVLRAEMAEAVRQKGLKNLLLLPFQPRELVPLAQSSADVMLLTSSPSMGLSSVPSKFITYLAVGKPVLCAVERESDIAKQVIANRLGYVVQPGSAGELSKAIVAAMRLSGRELGEMGERSRELAMSLYSMESALTAFSSLIQATVRNSSQRHRE